MLLDHPTSAGWLLPARWRARLSRCASRFSRQPIGFRQLARLGEDTTPVSGCPRPALQEEHESAPAQSGSAGARAVGPAAAVVE